MADHLPEHESRVRRLMADAAGEEYVAFHSLAEAQQDPDGVVVLEGDDGGQIYAVVPASRVICRPDTLEQLLRDLDGIAWPGNDPDAARVFFERRRAESGVAGGMGGGTVTAEGWVHEEFRKQGLEEDIRGVLAGEMERIRAPRQ